MQCFPSQSHLQTITHLGYWSLGPHLCYINSFITMVIWMEHMIMFAMLKVDKMLISMLPVGKKEKHELFET